MKTFLNLTFFAFLHFASQSQNLYLTASGGYNFSAGKDHMQTFTHNYLVGAFYPFNNERFMYSLGKGGNIDFGIGYTTKRNIGFEIKGSYLIGAKTIIKSEYFENDIFKKEIWGRFIRISPSVHFIHDLRVLSLKMSIGGLMGWGKMCLNQEDIYKGESQFKYENGFTGGYYLGFNASIGLLYPINKRLSLSVDVNWVNAYFSPTKARLDKFTTGSIDKTETLDVWNRELNYSSAVVYHPYNPDVPAQGLRENFAASSIGLQVGIQWNVWTGKKIEKEKEAEL